VLKTRAKPGCSCQRPGNLSLLDLLGSWLAIGELIDGIGTSVLVFETTGHAEEPAKYPVPAMPGVTTLDLTIREVFAHV
jgi:hypothetical protein